MRGDWTTTKLIAAGSVGVAMLILSLAGGVLNMATGISGSGGIINIFVHGGLTTFVVLVVRQFGSATIAWLVLTVLAIPLPIIGPPGFLLKILNGLFIGICADITFLLLKRRERLASIVVGGMSTISAGATLFAMLVFLKINWLLIAEKVSELLLTFPGVSILLVFSFIAGMPAGYLGWIVYDKLKNTATIRRIQGT